jgi:hypothetical protein
MQITIYPEDDDIWVVEAIDNRDGSVSKVIFYNSDAKNKAIQYVEFAYPDDGYFIDISDNVY